MTVKFRSDPAAYIASKIMGMSGKYGSHEIFTDWVKCLAIAISNSSTLRRGKLWQDREKMYLDTINRYSYEERMTLAQLTADLTQALTDGLRDILGEIYMQIGASSKSTGQFFTPYSLSQCCAKMAVDNAIADDGIYRFNEPSCGAGGMIIATADALRDKGINYQRQMDVVAQDIEWRCVYMCYIQLSLLGIKAICVQGDTLSRPYIPGQTPAENVLITPAKAGMFLY